MKYVINPVLIMIIACNYLPSPHDLPFSTYEGEKWARKFA
jgi:hypothetical protein